MLASGEFIVRQRLHLVQVVRRQLLVQKQIIMIDQLSPEILQVGMGAYILKCLVQPSVAGTAHLPLAEVALLEQHVREAVVLISVAPVRINVQHVAYLKYQNVILVYLAACLLVPQIPVAYPAVVQTVTGVK
jgi:hypothetical protein